MKPLYPIGFLIFLFCQIIYAQESFEKTFGSLADDESIRVFETPDSGFFVLGNTIGYGNGSCDFWLIKLNSLGDVEWDKTYGTPYVDIAKSISKTMDGGYIILGEFEGKTILVRINEFGDTLWTKPQDVDTPGFGNSIVELNSGDFIFTGGFGSGNLYFRKVNSSGLTIWDNMIIQWENNGGLGIIQSDDSTCITSAYLQSVGHGSNYSGVYLVKVNNNTGDTLWTRFYQGRIGSYLIKLNLNEYVIGGWGSFGGETCIYLMKFNSNGNMIFEKYFNPGQAYSIKQTIDKGFILTGYIPNNNRDLFLLKTDSIGNMEFFKTFGDTGYQHGSDVIQTSDSSYFICGDTGPSSSSSRDIYIIKTNKLGNVTSIKQDISTFRSFQLKQNYPNPFNSTTNISYSIPKAGLVKLVLYDVLGKEVKILVNGFKTPGSHKFLLNGKSLSSGIYYIKIIFENRSITKKLLLLK